MVCPFYSRGRATVGMCVVLEPLTCWRVLGGLQCRLWEQSSVTVCVKGSVCPRLPCFQCRRPGGREVWGTDSVYSDCSLPAAVAAWHAVICLPLPSSGVVIGQREQVAHRAISGEISAGSCACLPTESW